MAGIAGFRLLTEVTVELRWKIQLRERGGPPEADHDGAWGIKACQEVAKALHRSPKNAFSICLGHREAGTATISKRQNPAAARGSRAIQVAQAEAMRLDW